MKFRALKTRRLAVLAGTFSLLSLFSARAQTYIWADNAQGQLYETCFSGPVSDPQYWPSNSSWTQALAINNNCNSTATVTNAPSNWDPLDSNSPPLGVGVYPGGPGAIGVNVLIGPPTGTFLGNGGHPIVNSLIIETNGSLGAGANWSISLNQLEFQGDGTLASGDGGFLVGTGGTVIKSGGTGVFDILNPSLSGTNMLVEVDSGTLVFPSGFGAAEVWGGTFAVSNNATLVLTVDGNAVPFLNGNITGIGGGTVLFTNGSVSGSGGDLNLPGNMFQWTGGSLKGGPFTNSGVFNLTNSPQFYGGATLYNQNTVYLADNSALSFYSPGGAGPGLYNEAGGVFNIQGDSSITSGSGAVYNYGLFLKSAGAGNSQITPVFNDYGGTVEVDTGSMSLNVKGAGYFTNANFVLGNGAMLTFLTNNYNMEIEGNMTGSGGGTVLMNSGTVFSYSATTLNFPGALFQWAGGRLGSSVMTNIGTLNVSGPVAIEGSLANNGTMVQTDAGGIGGGNYLYNNSGALYDIQNDNGLTIGTIYNYGQIKKSAGTGTSSIADNLIQYGPGGSLEVDSGTLALANVGGNYFTNTALLVSNGATLDLGAVYTVNYGTEVEGFFTGFGEGTVLMTNGSLYCNTGVTLNFPGPMFQWAGGKVGSPRMTNLGTLNVSGPVALYNTLANSGTMIQSGAGSIGSGGALNNNPGAVYDIQNDNGLTISAINNYGLIRKSAGTGTSSIADNLMLCGPTSALEVDTGTLALANVGGNYFTNATLVVSNGATLDLAEVNSVNYATEIEGYLNGAGAGTVLMTNGTLYSSKGATMNFPGSMFQWSAGRIGNSSATITNAGTLNITGAVTMSGSAYVANTGTMIQSGAASVSGGPGLNNYAGGTYNIQNDNGISLSAINNYGSFEKTAGTGTNAFSGTFANYSSVQPGNGTFLFNGEFDQDAGSLQITPGITFGTGQSFYLRGGTVTGVGALGYAGSYPVDLTGGILAPGNPFGALAVPSSGTYMGSGAVLNIVLGGSNQFSQLAVKNYIQYGGTLNVGIINGYAPTVGTQFQIITNGSSGYSFSKINVPQGISLAYSNSGVYLTVTSAIPTQLAFPQVSAGNFSFSFGTLNGQSYTVQQNTNLESPNWTLYTNTIGDGSLYQITVPATNLPQLYFRVQEP